ncbi:glucokinase regulator family [Moniliophthora roreri MCA 2997]|uniref:Glucokinase regulator family n=2 Tax=Moniliophthora roreri TaxID=221103 RepID=V2XBT6_MONRO|nr:glucokinase regulator family [Moniliophthora roreri MCA 2997]KAI3599205.1 glucokinase regulator family [Moniliophthora roreri]
MMSLPHPDRQLILAIDAGGTKCTAVLATVNEGVIARGEAGPCNFSSIGLENTITTIQTAISNALSASTTTPTATTEPPPKFLVAWIGIAGLDITRPSDIARIRPHLARSLGFEQEDSSSKNLIISSDAGLLSSVLIREQPTLTTAIVLVAGTGSIAHLYTTLSRNKTKTKTETESPSLVLPRTIARAGGWGYLLGDEGSGYDAGRRAIRALLGAHDAGEPPTRLHKAVLEVLGCEDVKEVIAKVYGAAPKAIIASLSKVVMTLAFEEPDDEALGIVEEMVRSLVDLVLALTRRAQREGVVKDNVALVCSGSLLVQVPRFRESVVQKLKERAPGIEFGKVFLVQDAAAYTAVALAECRKL